MPSSKKYRIKSWQTYPWIHLFQMSDLSMWTFMRIPAVFYFYISPKDDGNEIMSFIFFLTMQ